MKQSLLVILVTLASLSLRAQAFQLRESNPYYAVMAQTDYSQNVGVGLEIGLIGNKTPMSFSVAGSVNSLHDDINKPSFYLLQGKMGYRLTGADSKLGIRGIGSTLLTRDHFTLGLGTRFSYHVPGGAQYFIEPLVDTRGRFYLGLGITMFSLDFSPRTHY